MNTFTIREAAAKLNVSEMYVRKLIKQGKIESDLKAIPGTKIQRHEISEESLEDYANSASNRSSREDGRNKFTAYFTPEEYEKVVKILNENMSEYEVESLISRTNPPKNS